MSNRYNNLHVLFPQVDEVVDNSKFSRVLTHNVGIVELDHIFIFRKILILVHI